MLFIPIVASIFSLIFAYFLIREIKKAPSGVGKMIEISLAIREGAIAFLKRQYKTAGTVALIIFLILWIVLGFKTGLGFLLGAAASALSGFIGLMISTQANLKVAEAAKGNVRCGSHRCAVQQYRHMAAQPRSALAAIRPVSG